MKDWLRGLDPKVIRTWATVGVAGVLLMLIANVVWNPPSSPTSGTSSVAAQAGAAAKGALSKAASAGGSSDALLAYEGHLDAQVTSALAGISGAGKVSVAVTLTGTPTRQYVLNTTEKTDTSASKAQGSTTTDTSVSKTGSLATAGNSAAVQSGEIGPSVQGVLVVATGATDPVVRDDLYQATATLLGVPEYKVMVEP